MEEHTSNLRVLVTEWYAVAIILGAVILSPFVILWLMQYPEE